MKRFKTESDLREAIAQAQHKSNLTSGGVYDCEGNLFSDIEVERRVAAQHKLTFVHPDMASMCGKPAGWHYRNFGYVAI